MKRLVFGTDKPLIRHDGSEPKNLVLIPDDSEFVREGSGLTTIEIVGKNVVLTVSKNGSLKITGNIGSGCTIFKEGNGTLTIEGVIADNLELTVYGQGNVIFTQRPPQKVIDAIKKRSGTGQIICAGVNVTQSSAGYMRHYLGIAPTTQTFEFQQQPLHQVQSAQLRQPIRQSSAIRSHTSTSQEENSDLFNEHTQAYIDSYKEKETIEDCISKLNLTAEEEPLFENFLKCITFSYYNQPPVRCNGRYYNVSTILELYKNHKPDPFEKIPLKLDRIDDGRDIYDLLEKTIIELKEKRAAKHVAAETQLNELGQNTSTRVAM